MEKKLTADKAIELIKRYQTGKRVIEDEYDQALTMAIEALQSKPKQGGLTAEEILEKIEHWEQLDRYYFDPIFKDVVCTFKRFALQSQPSTVTAEEAIILDNLPKEIFFEERIGTNGIKCLDYKNKSDIKYIREDVVNNGLNNKIKEGITKILNDKLINSGVLGREVIFEHEICDIVEEIILVIQKQNL